MQQNILVYADWQELGKPIFMGNLFAEQIRGKEIFSFEYDKTWLRGKYAQVLDPDLQLFTGKQYLDTQQKSNFGLFLDSSPDRWGRILMRRREAALARIENRPQNTLFELDYLLGVFDSNRMGGLRFKLNENGPFLNNNASLATPPWSSIQELEQISLRLEEEDVIDHPEYLKWLGMLIAPGSSLGGARPKASVIDKKKQLWIAKFPSKLDHSDTGGWEMVAYELALMAGINMAKSQVFNFANSKHTFVTKRFDRNDSGGRLHFASAMTLLGHKDGDDSSTGASYLELLDFIVKYGVNINEDLEQLWRRIVFNICISNCDDHLRNHGFLLAENGWKLSPAFDINPIESGTGLKLNISENDNALDIDLALEVSSYFRIKKSRAYEIVNDVKSSVKNWRLIAKKYRLTALEIELKSLAFERML